MGARRRRSRRTRRADRDTRRAWRVWNNGNCRFGALIAAVRRTPADTYRRATGTDYTGPEPFDDRLLLLRKEELLAWAHRDEEGRAGRPDGD